MTTETNHKDIWAEMMAEPRQHRLVPFPKNNPKTNEPYCEVAVVVLTAEESALVTREAEVKTRVALKEAPPQPGEFSKGYIDLFERYCSEGILYHAVRKSDDLSTKFFPRKEDIFRLLSVDQCGVLLNHYYTVVLELGPIIAELSADEAEAWIKRIIEGGTQNRFLVNSLSVVAWTDLIKSLVSQLEDLQMDRSLPGTPQENTT